MEDKDLTRRIFIFAALLLVLTGCGDSSLKAIDFQNYSSELLASDAFTEDLIPLDADIGCQLYNLDPADCRQSVFYLSSGATAEELAMFEATDLSALERIKDAIEERITYQTNAFESYGPLEVPKLNNCIVYTRGHTVILYVAADYDAAKTIQDKY